MNIPKKVKEPRKPEPMKQTFPKEGPSMFSLLPWRTKQTELGFKLPPNPYGEFPVILNRMRQGFESLMHRLYEEMPFPNLGVPGTWPWGLDVVDEGEKIIVKAEAPGFEPDDFDVRVQNGNLILRAHKKTEKEEAGGLFWEEHGCYQLVALPPGIEPEKVEAQYHNGVLCICFPKTKEGKGKRIPIKGL
jgi:HSP20 family protein